MHTSPSQKCSISCTDSNAGLSCQHISVWKCKQPQACFHASNIWRWLTSWNPLQHTVPETNKSAPSQSSPLAWARAGSNSKPQWSKLRNGCPTFDGFRPAATSHQSGSKLFIHPFASLARPPRQSSSGYGQVNASKFPHSLMLYAFDLKLKTESKTHVMSQTW